MADYTDEDLQRVARAVVREMMLQTVATPKEDLSAIAAAAARTAVQEAHMKMWAQLGFDMANMKDINRLRANLEFLNSLHFNTARAAGKAMFVIVSLLVTAVCAAVWLGVKAMIGGK